MTKTELRKKYKTLRDNLSSNEIDAFSISIANQLLKLPVWDFTFYHVFLSIEEKKEVNTDYILSILSGKDKNIVISKTNFEQNAMNHFLLTDNTVLKKSLYGIPEPVDGIEIAPNKIDVVFIPLLAFDEMGNRVGYGKGFYDKFLSECKPDTIKIGLSFFEAETVIDTIFEKDIPLHYCVTPHRVYSF
jgi:5-formyltetrahydrofolate cyclo-ligase